ncbi:hypothetical protein K8O68_14370 [Salipaludibacillus sp. CUR1]|uniref:hypothetical protein n=1 Tax=Salipaludibacillus sp. CUR1 TaxID=2820003 RepID=UPI001E4AEACE|nr:hypothetical protein [Salipaludibacillus sp. CUR1]MCE7793606.1 hypothetical protein [Salipaludibacillus sp. CUR1]
MDVIQPLIFIIMTFLLIFVFISKIPDNSSLKKPAYYLAGIVLTLTVLIIIAGLIPVLN